jgi:CpeT protein
MKLSTTPTLVLTLLPILAVSLAGCSTSSQTAATPPSSLASLTTPPTQPLASSSAITISSIQRSASNIQATSPSAPLPMLDTSKLPPTLHQPAEQAAAQPASTLLSTLISYMVGSFDSQDQAAKQPDDFMDIRLHMAPIWPARTDAKWLYIEQATGARQDRPYRQRIYRVTQIDATTFRSEVFELPGDPLKFAGAFADTSKLNSVTPEALKLRDGCDITLVYNPANATFTGSTRERACPSDLRGAAYASSDVTISSSMLISWDRGFNSEGKQVWGAEKAGYQFAKR